MTTAVQLSNFERLPLILQNKVLGHLSTDDLRITATVSKTLKQRSDDPKTWQALGNRLGLRVDPKNPKETFKNLEPINKLILDSFSPNIAEPIRKQNCFAQRAAILKLIEDFKKDPWNEKRQPFSNLFIGLIKKLSLFQFSYTEKNLLIFLFQQGIIFNKSLEFDETLFAIVVNDFDILNAFLEHHKKDGHINDLNNALRYVIHQEDPKFVATVMKAGAIPNIDHISDAITVIALSKNKEKMKLATAPIFEYFKSNKTICRDIPEAENIANFLVNYGKNSTGIQKSVKWYFNS